MIYLQIESICVILHVKKLCCIKPNSSLIENNFICSIIVLIK